MAIGICISCKDRKALRARAMCQKCYSHAHYEKKIEVKVKKTHCISCNTELLPSVRRAGDYCSKCYSKNYRKNKVCKQCKSGLTGSTSGICKICIKDNLRNIYGFDSSNILIKDNSLEALRKVLLRYKWNTYTLVDSYLLSHLYLEIYGHEKDLDYLDVESQLLYMLGQLKKTYDFNKNKQAT
jgi:hypothetical protein